MNKNEEPLLWVDDTDPQVLKRMYQNKLRVDYKRPSHLDVFAQQAIVMSKRSTCMFYEVGAIIFYNGSYMLSGGYNGAAMGDVDPRHAGCQRIHGGKLVEGKGFCRGTHAEKNAIGNLTVSTMGLEDLSMMVTLHPCCDCAKQIVNKHIKKVYYIWEYGREPFVTEYLEGLGVEVIHYQTKFLNDWIELNGYHSIGEFYTK